MIAELQKVKEKLDQAGTEYQAIYLYGSRIYQTANEESDWDFLVISEEKVEDLNVEPEKVFLKKIEEHDIRSLECVFANNENKYEKSSLADKINTIAIDLTILRSAISARSSHSWVKAKKKIEVENDIYRGIKSLYHSLRILNFGLQIAETGSIYDYTQANIYWADIQKNPRWPYLKDKYQKEYNRLKTEFRTKTR